MATVTKQTQLDGSKLLIVNVHITGATDLADTVLVDASTYTPAFTNESLLRVEGSLAGLKLNLKWYATSNVPFLALGDGDFCHDFTSVGGIVNNASTGKNGDIVADSEGASADTYGWIRFTIKKKA
jgi:hypothetical protein